MARLHKVEKSRENRKPGQPRPTCGRCGAVIEVGQPYYWWKSRMPGSRSGRRYTRCVDHRPRPSEMAFGYRATIMAAQESISDATEGDEWALEDLAQALRDAAQNVRDECAEVMRENADNMESAFNGSNSQADDLRDRAQALEDWCDELDSAADEIESMSLSDCSHDEEQADLEAAHEDCAEGDPDCDHENEIQAIEDEHEGCISDDQGLRDEAAEKAEDASGNCPE